MSLYFPQCLYRSAGPPVGTLGAGRNDVPTKGLAHFGLTSIWSFYSNAVFALKLFPAARAGRSLAGSSRPLGTGRYAYYATTLSSETPLYCPSYNQTQFQENSHEGFTRSHLLLLNVLRGLASAQFLNSNLTWKRRSGSTLTRCQTQNDGR